MILFKIKLKYGCGKVSNIDFKVIKIDFNPNKGYELQFLLIIFHIILIMHVKILVKAFFFDY